MCYVGLSSVCYVRVCARVVCANLVCAVCASVCVYVFGASCVGEYLLYVLCVRNSCMRVCVVCLLCALLVCVVCVCFWVRIWCLVFVRIRYVCVVYVYL